MPPETGKATAQDFNFESIVLRRIDGSSLVLYPPPKDDDATYQIFQGMDLTEGIYEPTVKGSITVRDAYSAFEGFNLAGGELLEVKAFTPNDEGEAVSDKHKIDCVFIVHDFQKITNEASESISGSGTGQVYWKLDFCTPEFYLLKQEESYLETDFIGKIAGDDGLVNILSEKYFSGDDQGGKNRVMQEDKIETTHNSVFLKKNNLMYPWNKDRSNPNLYSLLDTLSENSLSDNNPNAANYLFYNTTDGYAFESVNNMIIRGNDEGIREFTIDSKKPEDPDVAEYVASLSEFDHLSLWQNGGYSSYYRKIKPKYSEPYHDHLDFNDSHEKSNVDYLYHRDFDKIEHIEKYKLLPDDVETTPENGKRMYDNIHGYFGEHYNNSNRHADVTVLDYEDGYANDFGKPDGKTWQNMFDISELPAQELKIIKEIKDDVKENKKEYARLRNLRNKFDTYECSICCLQTSPGVTGSIDEYKIVSAGSFSDVVNYEPQAATEDEPAPPSFRKSYVVGEGGTGPWNETLGEFYYLKNSVPNYQEYVINLEIARLQLAIQANQQFLESCENQFCPEDEFGCNDCDDIRAFKCCTCKPNDNGEVGEGCGEIKFETEQRIERLNRRLEEWFEYAEKFPEGYDRNWNKKAYFISKEPEIEKLNQTITPTSLFNVKSITRKSLRGSRYEQFARKYNVKDGQLGEWIYNAYLGNDPSLDPTQPGNHPIYDQKYMDYSTSGPSAYRDSSQKWWGIVRSDRYQPICDTDCQGNPPDIECTQFTCSSCHNPEAGFWGGVNVDLTDIDRHTWVVGSDSPCGPCGCDQPEDGPFVPNPSTPVFEEDEHGPPWGLVAPQWHPNSGEVLLPGGEWNPYDFSQRWNFYLDDIAENTPVSIKRKEVQSYVRIEFESPIGLETLDEFPEGFIRDAGYEYFLPYLVMLTPGPFGKQGANKNVAVIGIDPYGFDVAVEPDDPDYGEDTTDGGMNLYPSEEWETERPYYTTSGNRGSRYYYGRYYGGSYYGRYYSSWWNKKAHAYDTLYYSSVNVSSGAPNSYYHFDYTAPLPVYHRYPYRRYGYYGYYGYNYYYGSSYWYNYNTYYGWNYGYENYWYDVYDYESPSLDEQDSFGRSGNYWWGWGWYYGYRWIWETESEYRPEMPENDVWKYDSSGNTDYGMVEPPQGHSFYYQRNNEENDFGRNFAAQFVVYSRRIVNSCSDSGYQCANPEGPVSSLGCPEDNIYCNCPCQELIPRKERVASRQELIDLGVDVPSTLLGITEYIWFIVDNDNNILEEFEGRPGASLNEVVGGGPFSGYGTIQDWLEENGSIEEKPTDEILEEAKRKTKECELISDRLGESWLGCMWSNLDDPISCNCPCRGDKFSDYVEYTRTWATYWDTPANAPLLRNAQMLQLNSQKALIVVNGDFSLKPGQLIKLNIPLGIDAERSESRVSGNWLVSQINHSFPTQQTHRMTVSLVRDTASVETQESSWVEWFKNILGL